MSTAFPSLARRVRFVDRLWRWFWEWLPDEMSIGRSTLEDAIREYERADAGGRAALRKLFADCHDFSNNVTVYEPLDSAESFRRHLLYLSLTYGGKDWRDTRLWLAELWNKAKVAGVDLAPILQEVAALSGDETETLYSAKDEFLGAAPRVTSA